MGQDVKTERQRPLTAECFAASVRTMHVRTERRATTGGVGDVCRARGPDRRDEPEFSPAPLFSAHVHRRREPSFYLGLVAQCFGRASRGA